MHVQFSPNKLGYWEDVCIEKFRPFASLYPELPNPKDQFGINSLPICVPSGEKLTLDAYFRDSDRMINFVIELDDTVFLTQGGFKRELDDMGPTTSVRLPSGNYLSIAFCVHKEIERV